MKNIFKEIGKGVLSFFAFILGAVVVAVLDIPLQGVLTEGGALLDLMRLVIVAGQFVVMLRLRCETITALSSSLAVIVFAIALGSDHIGLWMVLLLFAQVIPINLINERRRKELDKYRTSDGRPMGGSAIAQLHELEITAGERAAEYYAEIKRETAKEIFEEIEMLMKRHIFPVVREGVIEIEREPFLIIDPQDWAVLKSRYTFGGSSWAPTPTGEDEGGESDG